MASGSVISLGIQVDGEKTFNSALSAIDKEIKALGAGVESATAAMQGMGNTEEAAAKKTELLGKTVEANQKKLQILGEKYEAAKDRLSKLAEAMEAAQKSGDPVAIEKATVAYNKQAGVVSDLSARMSRTETAISKATQAMEQGEGAAMGEGKAMAEAGKSSDDLSAKVEKMSKIMTAEFAMKAAGAVIDGLKTIVSKAIEAGKAVFDLTTATGKYADDMLTLAATTNVDVVNLEKWEYASQFIDTSVDTLTGSLKKLSINMTSESKASAAAFDALGISVKDSSGNLRSAQDVMFETIDALGKVANETERDALAMAVFGKSATELNPIIKSGSQAFLELGNQAEAAGLILGNDALNALGEVDDAVNRMNSAVTAAGRSIAAEFAPAVSELTNGAAEVVTAFVGMIQGVEGSEERFNAAVNSLVENALNILTNMLPQILEKGVEIVLKLVEGIMGKISSISEVITKIVKQIIELLTDPKFIKAGIDILMAVIDGIVKAIPELAKNLPQIISAIVSGLAALAPRLLEAGVNIVRGLWEGIKNSIGWLWEQIKSALGKTFSWVLNLLGIHSPSTVMRDKVGKMLGLGVAEGIMDSADAVQKAYESLMPDPATLTASVDGYSVAARVADQSGESSPFQDNRPIILTLNDRELGRAVRGYVGYAY